MKVSNVPLSAMWETLVSIKSISDFFLSVFLVVFLMTCLRLFLFSKKDSFL